MRLKRMLQRAFKGYCKEDTWSVDFWFINMFPKILGEFIENVNCIPFKEEELQEEIDNFPMLWVAETAPQIRRKLRKYKKEFIFNDGFCNWLLILYRLKYCIEHLDECNKDYDDYLEKKAYKEHYLEIEAYKKETFYLLEKWFWDLWY